MIVLDANILVRAVLGHRVRQLLENYAARGLTFPIRLPRSPDTLTKAARKRGKSPDDVRAAVEDLRVLIAPVDAEFYETFEQEARERLRGRDEGDWPILACALGLGLPIWTEDADFFGTGVVA
jgi:predicted nucleic acid-binding protein